MGIAREWNLNGQMRLGIVCCAVAYLLLTRPWDEPTLSSAASGYLGSLAFLILALIPRRTRLWVAVCAAVIVPVVAGVVLNIALMSR